MSPTPSLHFGSLIDLCHTFPIYFSTSYSESSEIADSSATESSSEIELSKTAAGVSFLVFSYIYYFPWSVAMFNTSFLILANFSIQTFHPFWNYFVVLAH